MFLCHSIFRYLARKCNQAPDHDQGRFAIEHIFCADCLQFSSHDSNVTISHNTSCDTSGTHLKSCQNFLENLCESKSGESVMGRKTFDLVT